MPVSTRLKARRHFLKGAAYKFEVACLVLTTNFVGPTLNDFTSVTLYALLSSLTAVCYPSCANGVCFQGNFSNECDCEEGWEGAG